MRSVIHDKGKLQPKATPYIASENGFKGRPECFDSDLTEQLHVSLQLFDRCLRHVVVSIVYVHASTTSGAGNPGSFDPVSGSFDPIPGSFDPIPGSFASSLGFE
jgi:hypothetical protein